MSAERGFIVVGPGTGILNTVHYQAAQRWHQGRGGVFPEHPLLVTNRGFSRRLLWGESPVPCRVEGAVTRPSPHRTGRERFAHPVRQ